MFDKDVLRENHHEVTYILGRFMTDHLVRVYEAFGGDLTAAIVLGTIGQYNYRRYYDEVASHDEGFQELVVRGDHLGRARPCNAMSVSESTGIPRETVRRKIAELVAKGWLNKVGRDGLVVTSMPARHFAKFDDETLGHFCETAGKIRRVAEKHR